jgi:hypothetical protein
MRNKLSIVTCIGIACMSTISLAAIPAKALPGRARLRDESLCVVIAQVARIDRSVPMPGKQLEPPARLMCDLEILSEYRDRLRPGSHIRVSGSPGLQGSNPRIFPDIRAGQYVIIALETGSEPGQFEYAGKLSVPMGIHLPTVIGKDDVVRAINGMRRCREITDGPEIQAGDDVPLLRDNNYYIWSIGASVLTARGRTEDVSALRDEYRRSGLSVREALWLDYLLTILPEANRPSLAERHQLLITALRKMITDEK